MAKVKTFGVVLFEGFELLDVFGPSEAFGMLAYGGKWRVLTVAEKAGAIASAQGSKTIADFGFDDCPHIDILMIPGGVGTRREIANQSLLESIVDRARKAEIVTSVCTGAALLAKPGLLDGRNATTNKFSFKWVTEQGP